MPRTSPRRSPKRRSAPSKPRRRRRQEPVNPFLRPTSGFEGLIPVDSREDFFFASWLAQREDAAEFLEHGEDWQHLASDPRVGIVVSACFHVLILLALLIEPTMEMLGMVAPTPEPPAEERNPLVLFMEEPKVAEPLVAVPLVPAPPAEAAPAEPPPETADNRLLFPKALLAPPEDKIQEFMNDLPFSEGNTEEFYTDEEVKEPGEEGEAAKPPEEEPAMVAESGEDESLSEKTEGEEAGNGGNDVQRRVDARELGELLFGNPRARAEARPKSDIRPPEPKPAPGKEGVGGENGAFTDIRRFLAEARFDNPQGGLVSNLNNTLYYNDKGANFVPWLRRLSAEFYRNHVMPYSITFNHGHIAIGLTVARDGTILELRTIVPSGIAGFDNAAVGALRASRLLPLPADYPDDRFEIIVVVFYNERPYDIFG